MSSLLRVLNQLSVSAFSQHWRGRDLYLCYPAAHRRLGQVHLGDGLATCAAQLHDFCLVLPRERPPPLSSLTPCLHLDVLPGAMPLILDVAAASPHSALPELTGTGQQIR